MIQIPEFTKDDFLSGTAPYEFCWQYKDDPFIQKRIVETVSQAAIKAGVRSFKAIYKEYALVQRKASGVVEGTNHTQFEGQQMELNSGQWHADDDGIAMVGPFGDIEALNHPLMPVLRLVNVDSGEEKLKIAYRKGKAWRSVILDKHSLASKNGILELAKFGVAVNSENASALIKYLCDVESLNYDRIPEMNSVSRLGWIGEEKFSPYVDDIVYDGGNSFGRLFDSVKQAGEFEAWVDCVRGIRKGKIPTRIILASSFASALVEKVDTLSFFVHLWGSASGTGKTVGLMLAASVWANPEMGAYIRSFRGTEVSMELSAAFVNSLPLILDEFQMIKDKKAFEGVVYMLAEGVGKTRGSKTGGLKNTSSWRNCILSSGESPLTNYMEGAGAFNRIVEIECVDKLFDDPLAVLPIIKNNYGHAGRLFVQNLQFAGIVEEVKELYASNYKKIVESDTTEKQAMAAALILTADQLATKWIFKDDQSITVEDISAFLHSKKEVDTGERAYEYICDSLRRNANKFNSSNEIGEKWGLMIPGHGEAFIIRSVFEDICSQGNYSSRAVLSWLMEKQLIVPTKQASGKILPTYVKKIDGVATRCIYLKLPQYDDPDDELTDFI